MGAILRHQPGFDRIPLRGKPVSRGASRLVAKKPLGQRLPAFNGALLKRLVWPFLLLALGAGAYELSQRLLPYANQPIAKISVQGELSYSSQQMIQQRIAPFAVASFFSMDLTGLRTELESMPWIAHAEVQRIWPDQVLIRLVEQLPIARWGDEALLNNKGQAFIPDQLATYKHLPQLYGPKRAQQQIMQQYQLLSQLLRPLGFSVARLELRARGSWFLSTGADSSGHSIELLLGRDRLLEKMRRFIVIYDKTLKQQNANIARIDLRYAYGLAVSWREPVASTTADTNPAVQ